MNLARLDALLNEAAAAVTGDPFKVSEATSGSLRTLANTSNKPYTSFSAMFQDSGAAYSELAKAAAKK